MMQFIKKQPPARIIALGFMAVILLGSILLMLPFSVKNGVDLKYIDALYTSTSAVCVTGLIAADAGATFTPIGQVILALLIQVGGLGVTAVGAGIILMMGKKMNLKGRNLIQDAMNLDSGRGVVVFIKNVFFTTLIIELIGAVLSFIVFVQELPVLEALWVSVFHSVAAFNNSGFDILGTLEGATHTFEPYTNLAFYKDNVLLNLVTSGLIFFGGIGFLVIKEMWTKRLNFKKFSMHAKVVLSVSFVLILAGTLLIKFSDDNVSWLGALFHSISARTAGFSTYDLGKFSHAALLVLIVLMFIGASPGSTGGGVKTTSLFVLIKGIIASSTNRSEKAFNYSIPKEYFRKASIITLLGIVIVIVTTFLILVFDGEKALASSSRPLMDALFEATSAFGTVGLSTGISRYLSLGSKIVSIIVMYIGRLGPLTIATVWVFSKRENVRYPEGNIAIG